MGRVCIPESLIPSPLPSWPHRPCALWPRVLMRLLWLRLYHKQSALQVNKFLQSRSFGPWSREGWTESFFGSPIINQPLPCSWFWTIQGICARSFPRQKENSQVTDQQWTGAIINNSRVFKHEGLDGVQIITQWLKGILKTLWDSKFRPLFGWEQVEWSFLGRKPELLFQVGSKDRQKKFKIKG